MSKPTSVSDQRLLAVALRRLERETLSEAFDPVMPKSRPTEKQMEIYRDIEKIQQRFILAGNQCLAEGTLIATSRGSVPIESVQVGDTVYDPQGNPIQVKATFSNGIKPVTELLHRGRVLARCTASHQWLVQTDHTSPKCVKTVSAFTGKTRICRTQITAPLGPVDYPEAYALGALLGDGSGTQGSANRIYMTSAEETIVQRVAQVLGAGYVKVGTTKHAWRLEIGTFTHYDQFCKGQLSHQKHIDPALVRSWNRPTLLRFMAGLLDTDGSVFFDGGKMSLHFGMQAKSVVEAFQYGLLTLWQMDTSLEMDARDGKYVNGPIHYVRSSQLALIKRALLELEPYLVSATRRWKPEYDSRTSTQSADRVRIHRGASCSEATYDIHVDSIDNLYCLANGMVTHNSGKSSLAAREIAWILNGDHPFWQRPDRWGNEPLLIIIAGQDRKQMEIELWEKKLSPFLDKSEWKVTRSGGSIQFTVNRRTGDKIVFLSHSDSSETNRKHMQGYVAHYVWLDEMPGSPIILEELQRRVDARRGYLVATFTPKFRNEALRRVIDAGEPPLLKRYRMSKLDNPLYAARKDEEIRKLDGYSEAYKRAILYGEWYTGDSAVYEWTDGMMSEAPDYNPAWRHVEVVDPAISSKFGYSLWAENPQTSVWYMVKAEYISGIFNPAQILDEVIKMSNGYNIVRRISDHAPWFTGLATAKGITYMSPYNKNQGRKEDLIKSLQLALSSGTIKIMPQCSELVAELQTCQWSDNGERIINSSSFHLLDCAQYFVDGKPAYRPDLAALPWHQALREGNQRRKKMEAAHAKIQKGGKVKPLKMWARRGRGIRHANSN